MSAAEKSATIRPILDRIVVEPSQADDVTPGGIVLPEAAKEKPRQGVVIATGPGKVEDGKFVELTLRKGDVVLYGAYAGSEVKVDGKKYLIMAEGDVLAVLEKQKA